MASISADERPRERLRARGADALASDELIALLLRTGARGQPALELARRLLARFGTLDELARAGDAELASLGGLGPAKIGALRAAFELGARRASAPLPQGVRLESPSQVFAHFGPRLRALRHERFLALLLDSRHRLIREVEVSRGSLNQSLVHPREVFAPALREAAAALLVVHNHPSGDPEPSQEDREVTRRLYRAGELLGIRLLDHVVIGARGFQSLSQSERIFAQGASWRADTLRGGSRMPDRRNDRRRSARLELKIPVDYGSVDAFFSEFSTNINEGGMFVEMETPAELDTPVQLQFRLPGSTEPVQVSGRVAWRSDGKGEGPPGVGIEFQDLPHETREAINRIVRQLKS
jgi:DNA repair protein RadC